MLNVLAVDIIQLLAGSAFVDGVLILRELSVFMVLHAGTLMIREAIIALGKVGARQYSVELNLMLRNLNFNFGEIQDQRGNEIVAFSLVQALARQPFR